MKQLKKLTDHFPATYVKNQSHATIISHVNMCMLTEQSRINSCGILSSSQSLCSRLKELTSFNRVHRIWKVRVVPAQYVSKRELGQKQNVSTISLTDAAHLTTGTSALPFTLRCGPENSRSRSNFCIATSTSRIVSFLSIPM